MEVEAGIEIIALEVIDWRSEALWDRTVAQMLSNEGPVFVFRQGVVMGAAGLGIGSVRSAAWQRGG